jgi:two-component system sensor histidine kinase ChvG
VGTVHISATKKWRKGITIFVEDSGTGVRDELKEVIFDRFFTSRRGNAEVENSSGLGLYICKQIVEAHNGTITVSDRESGGSTFTVSL